MRADVEYGAATLSVGDDHTNAMIDEFSKDFYMLSSLSLNSILLIVYGITLVRVIRGTRFPFIIFLITFLIGSNIGGIAATSAEWAMGHRIEEPGPTTPVSPEDVPLWNRMTRISSISAFFRDGFFGVAIWTFCFRYWNISNVIPSALKG